MDLIQFASRLSKWQAHVETAHMRALEKAGRVLVREIRSAIGTYKYGWPPLAPSTLKRKKADTPLLETGKLRDSYVYVAEPQSLSHPGRTVGWVGSNDNRAIWFEYGTSKMPPRSVLGPALDAKRAEILDILKEKGVVEPVKMFIEWPDRL